MVSSAGLIMILIGGLVVIFGFGRIVGHLTKLDEFLDELSDSPHQIQS